MIDMTGFYPLFYKELMRFYKVSIQTVLAPIVTALLYFMIFSHVLKDQQHLSHGLSYAAFLIPGLMMMSMLQNAFANSSSSLILSKVTGNIVLLLIPPISPLAFFSAYVLASIVRGLAVGLGVLVATLPFTHIGPYLQTGHALWILVFAILGCATLGVLGLIAGLWAEKFDELALFSNFIITPATMLSGVFYSTHALTGVWQMLSQLNPFFYMIDGFRYGFFGVSDVNPWYSLMFNSFFLMVSGVLAYVLLKKGYKLKH
jgi:ABC-2 type transport system permease protein